MDIKAGDDITISGKVVIKYDGEDYVHIVTQSGATYFISINDIKTHRPINNREEDDLK